MGKKAGKGRVGPLTLEVRGDERPSPKPPASSSASSSSATHTAHAHAHGHGHGPSSKSNSLETLTNADIEYESPLEKLMQRANEEVTFQYSWNARYQD